ncbi:hypothetical protein EUX98_g946 [Antrodiella citrinella]|uniref:Uncharacterized protein n=1 Tax=Antrodiella citrinella TaxID=2447956 RepID=A0A4S4N5P6_9APHY|nr:hypothetical protein EUX98_g946 [Antrodiella citrinella]
MISVKEKAQRLRAAVQLLAQSAELVIQEWEKEGHQPSHRELDGTSIPSHELYNARRNALSAMGVCGELIQAPHVRLMEMSNQFYESRALHIAGDVRIADILEVGDHEKGMHIDELSRHTGINANKLARVLRTLCTSHVFREVSYDYFANNTISQALVKNESIRFISHYFTGRSKINYRISDKLPEVLMDPIKTQSESALDTAFQLGMNTKLHFFEWLEELVKQPDGTTKPKPELAQFGLAMLRGGQAVGMALYYDYPWHELGNATVVDIGGGVGGMSFGLAKLHPNMKFINQDRPAVIKQAETVWQRDMPDTIRSQRTRLMVHDFFTEQPVKGAEVYHLRYILHDWPDDDCVKILKAIRPALGPNSRILISEVVMLTTCPMPSSSFLLAPAPLPANYGVASRHLNMRDLSMLALVNGRERSPEEFRMLAKIAGLRVEKFWECRGPVWITEMRKDGI